MCASWGRSYARPKVILALQMDIKKFGSDLSGKAAANEHTVFQCISTKYKMLNNACLKVKEGFKRYLRDTHTHACMHAWLVCASKLA